MLAVIETSSAKEALALIEGGLVPDVVLTDHLMPGMTSTDLARVVKVRQPAMPVLRISGRIRLSGEHPGRLLIFSAHDRHRPRRSAMHQNHAGWYRIPAMACARLPPAIERAGYSKCSGYVLVNSTGW
jgi:CheY-like chemotaxis protein